MYIQSKKWALTEEKSRDVADRQAEAWTTPIHPEPRQCEISFLLLRMLVWARDDRHEGSLLNVKTPQIHSSQRDSDGAERNRRVLETPGR